jgi:ribulose 1,5-bisphosphate synthetase/thiazole synthase
MAPMAINDSITDPTHIDVDGNVEVEDVIVAGAGPAGLMLAYVVFRRDRHHVVLIKPT